MFLQIFFFLFWFCSLCVRVVCMSPKGMVQSIQFSLFVCPINTFSSNRFMNGQKSNCSCTIFVVNMGWKAISFNILNTKSKNINVEASNMVTMNSEEYTINTHIAGGEGGGVLKLSKANHFLLKYWRKFSTCESIHWQYWRGTKEKYWFYVYDNWAIFQAIALL